MDFRTSPNISVECVVFGFNPEGIHILLSNRTLNIYDDDYPIIDDWILTGGPVFKSEKLNESAARIFQNFTGLVDIFKKQLYTLGHPERVKSDKDLLWLKSHGVNHRVMAVVYYFLLPTLKVQKINADTKWFPIKKLPQLGFDHKEIIERAKEELKQKVMSEPIVFEFLPDKFTLNELQLAYELILDIKIDNRNFRKKAINKTYIVPLEEKRIDGRKKPANLYMFSKDIYRKVANTSLVINI